MMMPWPRGDRRKPAHPGRHPVGGGIPDRGPSASDVCWPGRDIVTRKVVIKGLVTHYANTIVPWLVNVRAERARRP